MNTTTKKTIIATLLTVGIDALIHANYTTPMETPTYFGIKTITLLILFHFLFRKQATLTRTTKYAAIFWAVFGLYYRITEKIQQTGYLSRVPDIHIGTTTITASTPLLSATGWFIIHGGAFITATLLTNQIIKQR